MDVFAANVPILAPNDFQEHAWATSRGAALAYDIKFFDSIVSIYGRPVYFRKQEAANMLDLALASPAIQVHWRLYVNTGGRENVPIFLPCFYVQFTLVLVVCIK